MPKNQTKRCPACGETVGRPHKENCPRPKNKKLRKKAAK